MPEKRIGNSFCKRNHDFANAFIVMARDYALNNEFAEAEQYNQQCLDSVDAIKDEREKKIVSYDFKGGPWYGLVK